MSIYLFSKGRFSLTNDSSHLHWYNTEPYLLGGKLLRIQQGWTCYTSLAPHCLKEPNLAFWVSLIRKLNVLKDNEWKNLRVFSILECRETKHLQVCSTKQLFSDLVSRATLPDSASLSFSLPEEWSPDFWHVIKIHIGIFEEINYRSVRDLYRNI